MGILDRSIRIIIAVVLVVLYFTNVISGMFAIVLLVVAGVFLLTSILSVCPLYLLLSIKTCKVPLEE